MTFGSQNGSVYGLQQQLEQMPIRALCIFEAYYEAAERARRDGHPGVYKVTDAVIADKMREKKREKRQTGRVTTTIRVGRSGLIEL